MVYGRGGGLPLPIVFGSSAFFNGRERGKVAAHECLELGNKQSFTPKRLRRYARRFIFYTTFGWLVCYMTLARDFAGQSS